MTNCELCMLFPIFLIVLEVAGCSQRSASNESDATSGEGTPTSGQLGSTSGSLSQTSQTSKRASDFFTDTQVAALAGALQRSDWADAEKAMKAGADVNATGKDGMYPLLWGMYVDNKAAFEWLLNHGADPNFDSGDAYGSVMFLVAKADNPDWLHSLLAHKANPNLTHKSSIGATETPLLAAVGICRLANLKLLIAAGANVNYQQPERDGASTPSIDAAGIGCFEGVQMLLKAGADIRLRTAGGADLTYTVARYRIDTRDPRYSWREQVLQSLRERGTDVDGALKAAHDAEAQDRKENPWRYQ